MRIYFENHKYNTDQIKPYLTPYLLHNDIPNHQSHTDYIGYIFVSNEDYSGPIFILPKSFLISIDGKDTVLGMKGIYPEDVINCDDEENPLELVGKGSFLPELGLWLYRALNRFRNEHEGSPISALAELDSQLPEDFARDKDFLSTALDLIDFLRDHRSLFTQISLINHSGRNKIDWAKTVKGDPFFENGEPWYLDPAIKEKTINIDDTLIVLYYSVLKYLRDKYRFPIDLGEVPYQLLSPTEVQRLIDTGIGSKQLKRIRHKYFRDDLKHLWGLLDSFFTFNMSDQDKEQKKEHLLVKQFHIIFEAMIDALVSDTRGVEALKNQQDGKLIDHIFCFPSLLGAKSNIYFIGDSKYYKDDKRPEGVALYKQFTYAKNTIQYHIDQLHLQSKTAGNRKETKLRYRDTLTEGYNITPNFFIRSRVKENNTEFDQPAIALCDDWNETKGQKYPPTNKHFEDRLFDRDTLILREFSVNLLFVIAAYAGYEDECWTLDIHRTIREAFITSIDEEYQFFRIIPHNVLPLVFHQLHTDTLNGRTYMLHESDDYLIAAFENSEQGQKDKEKFTSTRLKSYETGQEITYDLIPTSLRELSQKK